MVINVPMHSWRPKDDERINGRLDWIKLDWVMCRNGSQEALESVMPVIPLFGDSRRVWIRIQTLWLKR